MTDRLSKLAFSTNAYKQCDVFDAARSIAEIGYAGVEIMADQPHMNPLSFTDAEADKLAALIADLGLCVSNVNNFTGFGFDDGDTYHPTWVEPEPAGRRQRIDFTKRAIELTARIGGDRVSLQPGGPYVGWPREELDRLFADGIAACVDHARQHGVALGIEPEPGLLIERADQFAAFKTEFFADEPIVVMNCDIGHHFCVHEDPAEVIRTFRAGGGSATFTSKTSPRHGFISTWCRAMGRWISLRSSMLVTRSATTVGSPLNCTLTRARPRM
jgi:protein FrlC